MRYSVDCGRAASAGFVGDTRRLRLILVVALLPWVDAQGEWGEREALKAHLHQVLQSYERGDLEGSWIAYRQFLREVPPAHADWLLLTYCRSCPDIQILASILGKTVADVDYFDNVCPRQESGVRTRGWMCDQLIELLFRKSALLVERSEGAKGRLRLHRFYVRSTGDLRPWVSAGWGGGFWEDHGFFWIVDTGAHATIVGQTVVDALIGRGRLRGTVDRLGTSREVRGPWGTAGFLDALLHNFSVGPLRVGSVVASVGQLDGSVVGMNVLLRFPAVCFAWASDELHLGDLGPCSGGLRPFGARLSGLSPVVELQTGGSDLTRVLVDTGARDTYCNPTVAGAGGHQLRFGDHEDMWLSCGEADAAFLRDVPFYEAITGMDTLSRFDAFGWRLHPFTMYFVPKADD